MINKTASLCRKYIVETLKTSVRSYGDIYKFVTFSSNDRVKLKHVGQLNNDSFKSECCTQFRSQCSSKLS